MALTTTPQWQLAGESFERLLASLDADRERAGEKYERIRQKLAHFFRWRGCLAPDEYADRTIDRVARRLEEGAALHAREPYLFFHGVALMVLKEYWRQHRPADGAAAETAVASISDDEASAIHERRLECLDRCLARLPADQRRLLAAYHETGPSSRIDARRRLAQSLGIPVNALRIRAHRIRTAVAACVTRCVEGHDDEMDRTGVALRGSGPQPL